MLVSRNAAVEDLNVRSIEGQPVSGGALRAKPMLQGKEMTLLEIRYERAGVGAALHVHQHESLVYVVEGRIRTTIGEEEHVLGPGDACRHPAGVPHTVVALEPSLMVEVKSPAPDIAQFFGT